MVGVDHPQPELRKGVIAEVKDCLYGREPDVFVKAIGSSLIYGFFHLIFLYSTEIWRDRI